MSCRRIKKYLYLNDSELTEKEKIKLNNHLRKCIDCSKERTKIEEYNKSIINLINKEPILNGGDQLTNEIMSTMNKTFYRKESRKFTANIINILTLPTVRYSLIMFLIIIIGSFMAEEVTTSEDISRLEAAMNIKSSINTSNQADVLSGNSIIKSLDDALELIEGNKSSVNLPAGWVMLKKSDILKFMVTYDELQEILSNYSDIDLTDYPLLNKINLHNGLDENKLELLLSNKKELEKEMSELKNRENKNEKLNK